MPPTRTRFIVLFGLCGAAALAYLTRNSIGTAESTIRADLGITKEQSGWIMSWFFLPYALFQLPAAALSQRLGARKALPLFAILWSLASVAFAAGNLASMIGARVFMGIAQAGLVPVGISVMSQWFPRTGQGSASGAFSGFMSFGAIMAAPLAGWMVGNVGWRWMFVLFALPGILWALWFSQWFHNRPTEHPSVNAAELELIQSNTENHQAVDKELPPEIAWRDLVTSPSMACICAQQFCRAAGYIFFASWFATYLQEARSVAIIDSGWLTTLPLGADVSGCLLGGILSDAVLRRTGSQWLARQGVTAIALLICAGMIVLAWFARDPLLAVLIISAGMFCAAVANPCAAATVMSVSGSHVAAASGLMNMCGNFGAAAFPIVVPWLLHRAGGWNSVFVGFALLNVSAAVFWLLIRTEHPRRNC